MAWLSAILRPQDIVAMNATTLISALVIVFGTSGPTPSRVTSLLPAISTVAIQKGVEVSVNAKTGDSVSGERSFRVTVQSKDAVTQVEFYVGSDLRDNDTSTPYEFKLDTLNEADGDLKLRFKAYTTSGATGEKTITIKVANGTEKGADFHVQKANDLLADGKYDAAITEARIALKADVNSNPARLAMARANLGKGVLDQAQKYAEDAVAAKADDTAALDLLAAINLQKAFRTVNRGGDKKETQTVISDALKAAAGSRKKSLDLAVDKFGPVTDANRLALADAALRAGRYSLAISTLQPAFNADNRKNELANRLAYAQIRAGKPQDAQQTLFSNKKFGTPDAYGQALYAVVMAQLGDDATADSYMKEAILSDSEDLGVRTAQAYLALRRDKTATLAKLSADLGRDQGQRTEVTYYLSSLYNKQRQFADATKYYQRAALAEPGNADLYVDQGNQAVGITITSKLEAADRDGLYDTAKAFYEAALVARPESAEALTGLAMVALFQNRLTDAVKFAQAAVASTPSSAVAHYGLAAAADLAGTAFNRQANDATRSAADNAKSRASATQYTSLARTENTLAAKLDAKNLAGRPIPDAKAVHQYLSTFGRTPVLAAPK
jgi:thioredoxin-like negative regulator of GroEL